MALLHERRGSSGCFRSQRYYHSFDYAIYACGVIFFAVYLGILIALCIVRRKSGPGKRLIGLPYMLALLFMFVDQAIEFLSSTLQACEHIDTLASHYAWWIASTVFYGMHSFLLLFVVIYMLNTMLRKQLGHNPSSLKIAFGSLLFILGGLILSYVVIRCYLYRQEMRSLYSAYYISTTIDWMSPTYIHLAFYGMFLLSILGSGTLSILAARSLKKRHGISNSLTAWISVLILSLIGLCIISIIQLSASVSQSYFYYTIAGVAVMYYMSAIFRALSFISVIVIAKDAAWRPNANVGNAVEPQYAYNYQQEPHVHGGMAQRA